MFLTDVVRVIDDIGLTSPETRKKNDRKEMKIGFVARLEIDQTHITNEQRSRIDQINKMQKSTWVRRLIEEKF